VLAPNTSTTTSTKYPKTFAAVEAVKEHMVKAEEGLWLIAVAVRTECGPLAKPSEHNGSEAKIKECAKELGDAGHEYAFITLRKMRDTADAFLFPADRRLSAVSLWVHEAARDPETLIAAKEKAEELGVKLTVKFAQTFGQRRNKDALSAAERANNDVLDLISDLDGALDHLFERHLPHLSETSKSRLQAEIANLISNVTAKNDLLNDEPWREAAE